MPGRAYQREDCLASGDARFDRGDRTARGASCRAQRGRVDDRVAGGKITGGLQAGRLALDEFDITVAMNALDLGVGRIACRDGPRENAAVAQTRRNDLNAIGSLGMRDAANVLPVEPIGDELQPECFVGGRQESVAAFCTVA
jgi:hypothetical protein